jgi:hypothetical protein
MALVPARPALVPPAVAFALLPDQLATLLRAVDAPAAIVALAASGDVLAVARALFVTPLDARAAAAIHVAATLATPLGRHALVEGLDDLGERPEVVRGAARGSTASLAVTAVAGAFAQDAVWERAIDRAFIRLARSLPEPLPYELWARAPIALDAAGLAALLAELPRAAAPPSIVEDAFGVLHAAVPYTRRETRVVRDERGGIRAEDVEILFADLVSLDPPEGRIRITTEDPERARLVVAAFGARGLAAPAVLLGKPAFTLRPLLDRGAAGIATMDLPPRVRRLEVIACQVLYPGGGRNETRDKDAVAKATELVAKQGGYLHRATFRLAIEGAEAPVDAFIQLPNRVGISDARWAREVWLTLAALGVTAPGAALDDLTTLASGARPDWRWREVFGDEAVDRMKAEKLLELVAPGKSSGAAILDMRAQGDTARRFTLHHPLDEGNEYALADDPLVPARTVGPKDRETWRIDRARLAKKLAADLGLEAAPPCEGMPEGALDLGLAAGGHARVVFVLTPMPESSAAAFASAVAKAALPAHAVLLVPRGRPSGHALTVELDLHEQIGARSSHAKLEAVLAAADLAGSGGAGKTAAAEIVLALPGTLSGKRTDVVIDGALHRVQHSGFVVLFAAVVAAARGALERASYPKGVSAQAAHEAVSRLQADLKTALPRGMRLVSVSQDGCRLGPGVRLGEVAWEALERHPDVRIRKLAGLRPRRA